MSARKSAAVTISRESAIAIWRKLYTEWSNPEVATAMRELSAGLGGPIRPSEVKPWMAGPKREAHR